MRTIMAGAAALVLLSGGTPTRACTTFCFDNRGSLIFGKNYDWSVEEGLAVVNKRGVGKVAFTGENPARWTSRYGSVTFNQYGREFPSGGMNERGLVIELMWLDETQYPAADARQVLPTLQWIQYQLDNSATVDDVMASDVKVRISAESSAPIHFLVADATGGTAAVEFLGGRMVVHRGREMPYRALTNDTYEKSAAYAKAFNPKTSAPSSLDRFARAAHRVKDRKPTSGDDAVAEAFALLQDVSQGEYTRWSIVYDIGGRRVHFRTHAHDAIRFIDFGALDFTCATPVRIVDLNAHLAGNLAKHMQDYAVKANLDLVRASFSKTDFLSSVPPEAIEMLANYPEQLPCTP